MTLDEAHNKYNRMVYYAAIRLRGLAPSMDVEDLSQEGLMLLVNIWQRSELSSDEKESLFRRDLISHLRNKARGEVRSRVSSVTTIDLDSLFAQVDCSVLPEIYANEYKKHAYSLFSGVDRVILDSLIGDRIVRIESVKGRYCHAAGQWLQKLSSDLGITRSHLSQRISNIRRRLRDTLAA